MNRGVCVAWVADRSGGALIGVDQNLLVCAQQSLEAPSMVSHAGGVVWAVSGSRFPWLSAWSESSYQGLEPIYSQRLGRVLQLWAVPGGRAFVLTERGDRVLLQSHSVREGATELKSLVQGDFGQLGASGLLRHDPQAGQLVLHDLQRSNAPVRAVQWQATGFTCAVAASLGGWWCLDASAKGHLERRNARLELIWRRPLGFRAERMVDFGQGVLVVGGRRLCSQRFDLTGQAESPMETLVQGPLRGAQRLGGGFLLAVPGALLKLTPSGELIASQGGFGEILGLAGR